MENYFLEFEKPIIELDSKIKEMQKFEEAQNVDLSESIDALKRRRDEMASDIFAKLNPWQIVELARHPLRPQSIDYIQMIASDFIPLYGDKLYHEDQAIICGFCRSGYRRLFLHQKVLFSSLLLLL